MIFELVRVSICKVGKGSGIHSIAIASLDFRFIVGIREKERRAGNVKRVKRIGLQWNVRNT